MDEFTKRRADKLMKQGLDAVAQGDTSSARESFKASAAAVPTADAVTYWAWMEHHLGETETALELCEKAIALDPDFGNPYNDIGSYLIALHREDEAIPWLEKAKTAKRYEPRQFPFINLGRIYLAKNMQLKALKEFEGALEIVPEDSSIAQLVAKLRSSIH